MLEKIENYIQKEIERISKITNIDAVSTARTLGKLQTLYYLQHEILSLKLQEKEKTCIL